MSSGIHGIGGFTGSAVQRYFLSKVLKPEMLQNMGIWPETRMGEATRQGL